MAQGYELACRFQHETAAAILIYDYATEKEVWLPLDPLFAIHGNKIRGNDIVIDMPEWLAKVKGLEI